MPVKKIAIFVEGQSEQIFIRNLLFHLFDPAILSFACFRLRADRSDSARYPYNSPNAKLYFQIIDVGNDEKVLSAIRERAERLFASGFTLILGLRDMYSREYRKKSAGKIDDAITEEFLRGAEAVIAAMQNKSSIHLHFAIMEIESWWLAMYNLFSKIDEVLSPEFIEEHLQYNLREIDPQTEFFHPTQQIEQIYQLVGRRYNKTYDQVEAITSNIEPIDVLNAMENGRCQAFRLFYKQLISTAEGI